MYDKQNPTELFDERNKETAFNNIKRGKEKDDFKFLNNLQALFILLLVGLIW